VILGSDPGQTTFAARLDLERLDGPRTGA
jgi:hypothetical protein